MFTYVVFVFCFCLDCFFCLCSESNRGNIDKIGHMSLPDDWNTSHNIYDPLWLNGAFLSRQKSIMNSKIINLAGQLPANNNIW